MSTTPTALTSRAESFASGALAGLMGLLHEVLASMPENEGLVILDAVGTGRATLVWSVEMENLESVIKIAVQPTHGQAMQLRVIRVSNVIPGLSEAVAQGLH